MRDSDKYHWLLKNLKRHGEQSWSLHLTGQSGVWTADEQVLDALIVREIMQEAKKSITTEDSI